VVVAQVHICHLPQPQRRRQAHCGSVGPHHAHGKPSGPYGSHGGLF
jgi:hypothetical protein